jgi:hypothetical protein
VGYKEEAEIATKSLAKQIAKPKLSREEILKLRKANRDV